jgi:pantoate--beta-alanine ligase
MQIIASINEMQSTSIAFAKEGKRIGFVPTMGCLHEGHLSLIDIARTQCDIVVVSNFVNPVQFGPSEDFARYPRQLEQDMELCKARGVDVVFAPDRQDLYPDLYSTYINEEKLSSGLCGITRPHFFKGVCTVVAKLFNIVRPDVAVFGQKDAQQVAVIRKMVRDLNFPIEIVIGPTVREPDGLAMSSRNRYLNEFQRRDAALIYQSLKKGMEIIERGSLSADRFLAEVIHHLNQVRRLRIIYVSAVDIDTIEPVREIRRGRTLIALAVWCDEVRLIDNMII